MTRIGKMLGRYGRSFNGTNGQYPCSECAIGHTLGRRARKRIEERQWRNDEGDIEVARWDDMAARDAAYDDDVRAYVSALWSEDWDNADDAVYDSFGSSVSRGDQ